MTIYGLRSLMTNIINVRNNRHTGRVKTRPLSLSAIVSMLLLSSTTAIAQEEFQAIIRPTEPLSPAEQQKTFQLPPGFEIQLVAAEPQISKPMNLAFDSRGRLWVTESVEYPYPAPADRAGRDAVKILEDTNGDGHADQITTFADELNIPIGIYPYKDGAIVFSIPHIWHLRDTDGDGHADSREPLYGPMGYERDTHGLNNAFRRGFDGWLYACHGFNNETTVKGTDGHTVHMQSGNTYRMRLDGSHVEQFTWGQVNPFGMSFDPHGNIFTADCHSKPIYQLLREGYYPSFGKPHNGLGFVPPMMDHLHGSTAIAGIAYYAAKQFPREFQGNIFTGNVMTSRVNRNSLNYSGSTITAQEEPDFLSTIDPWFRPVDICLGPDGALYIADFYNRIIGHYEVPLDHPGRDRHRGRIWRIVYTGESEDLVSRTSRDYSAAGIDELIAGLSHPNLAVRSVVTDEIVDRVGKDAVPSLHTAFSSAETPHARAHLLCALHRLGDLHLEEVVVAANDDAPIVRIHAMKLLAETVPWMQAHFDLATKGLIDQDAFVQRAAADALGQHPRFGNIAPLLDLLRNVSQADSHLIYTIRIALRNQLLDDSSFGRLDSASLSDSDALNIAGVAVAIESPASAKFLLNVLQSIAVGPGQSTAFVTHAAQYIATTDVEQLVQFVRGTYSGDLDLQKTLFSAVDAGLQRRGAPRSRLILDWGHELAKIHYESSKIDLQGWSSTHISGKPIPDNPWEFEQRRSADGNDESNFLSSLPHGEGLTGRLRSPAFDIPTKMSFYIAGHDGNPTRPRQNSNVVRLRDAENNKILAEEFAPRNDVAQQVQWDLAEFRGRRGFLEIVDRNSGRAYAWFAVGRFDPAIVEFPPASPAFAARRQTGAAEIVAALAISEMKPQMRQFLEQKQNGPRVHMAAAQALESIDPDSRLAALLPLIGNTAIDDELRDEIVQVVQTRNAAEIQNSLIRAFKTVPLRVQTQIAESLVADSIGSESFLSIVATGHAAAGLLRRQSIAERLRATASNAIIKRVEELTANLPDESVAMQRLLIGRTVGFPRAAASASRGQQLFIKHCQVCHKIGNQGSLIGPQLDGIGNRGAERLIEDVLAPNRNVDVAFRVTTIVMQDGKVYSGLIRREEGASLILADNKGKEITLPISQIEERKKSQASLMPENVEEILTEPEFYDLLAYLLTNTDRSAAARP